MIDPLLLAGLLCSRLCHDLVGPVGAVVNGVELLTDTDDDDDELRDQSIALIGESAAELSARLRFFRVAFGTTGGDSTTSIDEVMSMLAPLLRGRRITVSIDGTRDAVPRPLIRALFVLALVAADCLPRGGRLAIDLGSGGGFSIEVEGDRCLLPAALGAVLAGESVELDPKTVAAALALQLAANGRQAITVASGAGRVRFDLA